MVCMIQLLGGIEVGQVERLQDVALLCGTQVFEVFRRQLHLSQLQKVIFYLLLGIAYSLDFLKEGSYMQFVNDVFSAKWTALRAAGPRLKALEMKDMRLIAVKLYLVSISNLQGLLTDPAFIPLMRHSIQFFDFGLKKSVPQEVSELLLVEIRQCSSHPQCCLVYHVLSILIFLVSF